MSNSKVRQLLQKELDGGLSHRKLAARIGIPAASIGNYLDTDMQPTRKTLEKIGAYFHLPISVLIDEGAPDAVPPVAPISGRRDPEDPTLLQKYASALERIIDLERQLQEARSKQLLTGNALETASDG